MSVSFLRQVCAYYMRRPANELSGLTFVTPNKRSAMFLKRYFRDAIAPGAPVILPRFITFGRLLSHFSEYGEGQRNELLFHLFDAMREACETEGIRNDLSEDFDSFIFWGDMMLSDFDVIDTSLANPADIFKNIRDLREIQSDFLTPEQKDIVRKLWGDNMLTRPSNSESPFWLHLDSDNEAGVTRAFKTLWSLEGKVYEIFHRRLREAHIGTPGTTARTAWKAIRDITPEELPYPTRYVFAGFGETDTVETLIMKRFRDIGIADFFWDIEGASAVLGQNGPEIRSVKRIQGLAVSFPSPADFEPINSEKPQPRLEVVAAPSKIAQAKCVKPLLERWLSEGLLDPDNAVNTAIVLPDESLLMPLLFSIPEEITAINITMGVPYRTTAFAQLLQAIIRMQKRSRRVRGEWAFFYEDVVSVLGHPHVRLIARESVDEILRTISDEHLFTVTPSFIASIDPNIASNIFRPVNSSDIDATGDYLLNMIDCLYRGLMEEAIRGRKRREGPDAPRIEEEELLETKFLKFFRDKTIEIMSLAGEAGIDMKGRSFLTLLERLLGSTSITMNGRPLRGLQIMGVLETRALDFDNVVILSMNEDKFPKKHYTKTMIPNAIRIAYDLPDLKHEEGVYAYCFYRLLGRAKNVSLVYDSRTGTLGAGEESRYISQLRFLIPEIKVADINLDPGQHAGQSRIITIEKTPDIIAELDDLRAGGNSYISASAIKTFKKCPLQFYLSYVKKLRDHNDLADYVTAADSGTILHDAFRHLYLPYEKKTITREILDKWIANPETYIRPLIADALYSVRHPLRYSKGEAAPAMTTEEQTVASAIERLMVALLKQEIKYFLLDGADSFTYLKGECLVAKPWKIADDLTINFKMYIDRVDRKSDGILRFIDYKTGSDERKVDHSRLTDPDYSKNSDAVLQLLIYCEAFADIYNYDGYIQPLVYLVRGAFKDDSLKPIEIPLNPGTQKKGQRELGDFRTVSDIVRPRIEQLIRDIFDPAKPFSQTSNTKNCSYCPFTALCGRQGKDDE